MKKIITIVAALALAANAINAHEAAENKQLADSAIMLGEVAVTAIKQSNDLTLLPLASTVVGQLQVERFNIKDVKGVSALAPNVYMPDYGSSMTSSVYVRGIGARIDQPSVGMSVDNVTFLSKDVYDFDLFDIERIEVLRGVQSSLYGRNTMAGQFNIYTLSPKYYQGTRAMAEMSTGLSARVALSHYRMFNSKLGMGFSANFNYSDGFYKNAYNNESVGTDKNFGFRWKTTYDITPDISLMNTASFNLSREGGYAYEMSGSNMINYNDTCFYRRNTFADGLTIKWTRPGFSLSSITSVQYIDDNLTLDQDFTPQSMFTLTQKRKEWAFTQDFVARGEKGIYSWLGGLFGFYKNSDMNAPVTLKEDGIKSMITDRVNGMISNMMPPNMPSPRLEWGESAIALHDDFEIPVWGLALYHQSNVKLGRWNLGLGMRLDYEKSTLDYRSYTNTSCDIVLPPMMGGRRMTLPLALDVPGHLEDDFLEFIPKFTVSYELPMPGASDVYFSVGKGYKSGGFNTQMFSEVLQQRLQAEMMSKFKEMMPPQIGGMIPDVEVASVEETVAYKPERSWNFEVGTHVTCADNRVRCDIAAFYIDCNDQQVTMFPPGTTTGRITSNAAKSRMWGAEAQIRFTPIQRLLLNLNYGYTNAKFEEFVDGNQNYAGKYVPYAPQHTLFASATYRQPLPWALNAVEFTGAARGVGRIYWDEMNTISQPFYATMSLSATLCFDWMDLELWSENLTDTDYDVFYFKSMGNQFLQTGNPRRFGATLRFNF